MKHVALSILALLGSAVCAAQEYGRVVSSTPLVQQIQVPQQICTQEMSQAPAQKSGAGAAIGAIAGAALGNAIGHGGGRAAATMAGVIGGAVLGDQIEGSGYAQAQNVQRCSVQYVTENRVIAYQVVYEYAGKQYAVQMAQDPGPQVQLQITPIATASPPAPAAPMVYPAPVPPPVVVAPPPVFIASTTSWYPAYVPYPYRPSVGVNLHFGYRGGHYSPRRYGHRH